MAQSSRHVEFDFRTDLNLTLAIASVRFGGGAFGFPRPKSLFILQKNVRFELFLTKTTVQSPLFSRFPSAWKVYELLRHVTNSKYRLETMTL